MNFPGYPQRQKLPSIREIDSTSGAPHTPVPPPRKTQPSADIEIKGNGWNLTLPAVVCTGILSTLGAYFAKPAALPADDEFRRDVAELRSEIRYLRQEQRELRAQQAQAEQANNELRAELLKTNRLLEQLRKSP